MSVGILNEEECRQAIWERLASNEWWAIPWVSEIAQQFCQYIEGRYCTGEDGAEFELFMIPRSGLFAVAFVRKAEFPAPDLADVFLSFGIFPPETRKADVVASLNHQDILVCVDARTESARNASLATLEAWKRWMGECPEEER